MNDHLLHLSAELSKYKYVLIPRPCWTQPAARHNRVKYFCVIMSNIFVQALLDTNPSLGFQQLVTIVSRDSSVLLDFLVSNETCFLLYFLRFLKFVSKVCTVHYKYLYYLLMNRNIFFKIPRIGLDLWKAAILNTRKLWAS